MHFLKVRISQQRSCSQTDTQMQEWTDEGWHTTTLAGIGLIYQLGHKGLDCNCPVAGIRSTQVLDTTGVQTLKYQFCGCRAVPDNNDEQLEAAGFVPVSEDDQLATRRLLDTFATLNLE